MTPADIDRVFGRGRLRMVTGDHVEVFREASLPGERRRYTKRFLTTEAGDFREWTAREWRLLARLVGHGIKAVPEVVQFDRGSADRSALVQTYDAGVTVDHWATLLPLERDGVLLRNVFEECSHWWALAQHSLMALDAIHELRLVHLDLKPDNVCIPAGPADFNPLVGHRALHPRFEDLTLIDFAFSMITGERLDRALPIAEQPDYAYQSPRLLRALEAGRHGDLAPTRGLDWRCDFFSLAAMLWRYLPELEESSGRAWTRARHARAVSLVRRLMECHDAELPESRPHAALIALTAEMLTQADIASSLQRGWTLAIDADAAASASPTPVTRIAPPLPIPAVKGDPPPHEPPPFEHPPMHADVSAIHLRAQARQAQQRRRSRAVAWAAAGVVGIGVASVPFWSDAWRALRGPIIAVDPRLARSDTPPMRSTKAGAPAVAKPTNLVVATPPTLPPRSAPSSVELPVAVARAPSSPPPTTTATPRPTTTPVAQSTARQAEPTVTRSAARQLGPPPRAGRSPSSAATVAAAGAARGRPPLARATPTKQADVAIGLSRQNILARAQIQAAAQVAKTQRQATTAAAVTAEERPAVPSPVGAVAWAVAGKVPAPVAAVGIGTVTPTAPEEPVDFTARASELMTRHVPVLAQRAERLVARVLFVAAHADSAIGSEEILASTAALGRPAPEPVSGMKVLAAEAQSLGDAARAEYERHGATRQALMLQVRAFGANPVHPEIVGNLAFLLLRQQPSQAAAARQVALYALSLRDTQHPRGRIEDWATFGIASALSGHDRDAENAFLVSLTLAPDLSRLCQSARDVHAMYGERLRVPVQTLISRAQASSRVGRSSPCDGPLLSTAQANR